MIRGFAFRGFTFRGFAFRGFAYWILLITGLTACSKAPDEVSAISVSPAEVIELSEDLAELKADFNAAVDQVRLVFIVGPT